jgi:hypothetical protein
MRNIFGVEHDVVSKLGGEETAATALKTAHKAGEHVRDAVKACPMCGPGSQRARMSMSAWESQTAAARRGSS